jgi:hypothetical protein
MGFVYVSYICLHDLPSKENFTFKQSEAYTAPRIGELFSAKIRRQERDAASILNSMV